MTNVTLEKREALTNRKQAINEVDSTKAGDVATADVFEPVFIPTLATLLNNKYQN